MVKRKELSEDGRDTARSSSGVMCHSSGVRDGPFEWRVQMAHTELLDAKTPFKRRGCRGPTAVVGRWWSLFIEEYGGRRKHRQNKGPPDVDLLSSPKWCASSLMPATLGCNTCISTLAPLLRASRGRDAGGERG